VALTCPQCGTVGWLNTVRRRWRPPTCWCERCGASMPASAVVDVPAPPAGAKPKQTDPLAAIMPAKMAEWVVRRHGGSAPTRLDRAVVYQLYRAWDEATVCELPRFSAVVGALHAAAYDLDAAYPDAADRPGLRERAGHARAWLYRYAPDRCWILGPLGDPADLEQVREALAAIRAGAPPASETARAAWLALFGVDSGPGLRGLRQVFGDEAIAAALEDYLRSGERPLRDRVLASLEGAR
jgi:hypothetical protein